MTLTAASTAVDRRPAGVVGRRPRSIALVAGLISGLLAFLLLTFPTPSVLRVVILLMLLILLPTSRRLSHRLLINVSVGGAVLAAMGWSPQTSWCIPVIVSTGYAVVVWRVALTGFRATRPMAEWSDLTVALAGCLALLMARPLIGVAPERALAALMHGWDHASHFDMYLAHRSGARLPLSPDAGWNFDAYPQLFHAQLSGLAEVMWGGYGTTSEELGRYATLQGAYFALTAALGTAAILHAVRRAPTAARMVAPVLGVSLLLGYPGALSLMSAHLNFLAAVVAGGAFVLLVTSLGAHSPGLGDIAAGACLLMVVGAWPLLLPVVAPAAFMFLRMSVQASQRSVRAVALVCGAVAIIVIVTMCLVSMRSDVREHLTVEGGLFHPDVIPTAILLVGLAALAMPWQRLGRSRPPLFGWSMACGVLLLCGIAVVQLVGSGTLSYYFWKTSVGVESLVLLVAVPWLAVVLTRRPDGSHTAWTRIARPVVITMLVAVPGLGAFASLSALPIAIDTPTYLRLWSGDNEPASQLLQVASEPSPADRSTHLLVLRPNSFSPGLMNQWYHSLTRSRTYEADAFLMPLDNLRVEQSPTRAVGVVREVLSSSTDRVAVIDPRLHRTLTAALPQYQDRLVLIPVTGSLRTVS